MVEEFIQTTPCDIHHWNCSDGKKRYTATCYNCKITKKYPSGRFVCDYCHRVVKQVTSFYSRRSGWKHYGPCHFPAKFLAAGETAVLLVKQ